MTSTIHKLLYPLPLLFTFFLCFTISQQAAAKDKTTVIADGAGLLSTDDIAALTETCDDIAVRYSTSIYIISTDTMDRDDGYSDYLNTIITDKKSPKNLIVLFISTKAKDNFCVIRASGDAKKQITQKRCDNLARAVEKEIRNGDAYTAIDHCADTIVEYFQTKPFTDFILFHPILQVLLCLATAGITLCLAVANPLPKQSFRHLDYASDSHSEQLGHLDTLLRTAIQEKQ